MIPKCVHGKDIWQHCEECPPGEVVGVDPNRPYPEGVAFDEAWRQRQRADAAEAAIGKLSSRVRSLEYVVVSARREFRRGGDPVDARSWLFRVEIDESKFAEPSA